MYLEYVRSLLIYHLTPFVSSGLLPIGEVKKFETLLKRKLYGFGGDVKSKVIVNLTSPESRDACQVI